MRSLLTALRSAARAWQRCNLMLRILIGIILGTLLALVLPSFGFIAILGDLFVGALKAIAPLLVALLVLWCRYTCSPP